MTGNFLAVDFNSWSIFEVVSEMEQAVTTLVPLKDHLT